MGTVPISNISPLTVARTQEPVLEAPVPIYKVESSSGQSGGNDEECYSPSEERAAADAEGAQVEPQPDQELVAAEAQSSPADAEPSHQVNLFA